MEDMERKMREEEGKESETRRQERGGRSKE